MHHYICRYSHPLHPWLYIGRCHGTSFDTTPEINSINPAYNDLLLESEVYYIELNSEDDAKLIERYLKGLFHPYINYGECKYSNEDMARACSIISKKNWIRYKGAVINGPRVNLSKRFVRYSRYTLTPIEHRVLMYILNAAQRETKKNQDIGQYTIYFDLDHFLSKICLSTNNISRSTAIGALLSLSVKRIDMFFLTDTRRIVGFIEKPILKNNIVGVSINQEFAKYCNLDSQITLDYNIIERFSCKYSAKIYEFVLANRKDDSFTWNCNTTTLNIAVRDLSSKMISDIRKSIWEINNKSDVFIDVTFNYRVDFSCRIKRNNI